MAENRIAELRRTTKETDIQVRLAVDGSGLAEVDTGIPFFDHMLTLFAKHGLVDLSVQCRGDVEVDYHHTVEDVGIALGEALRKALGDKAGLVRYGCFTLPMDETLVQVAVDFSGRAYFVHEVPCAQPYVRDFNIVLVREFFRSLSSAAGINLHQRLISGDEAHHIAEALFKATARAIDAATRIDPRLGGAIPTTKGQL